MKKFCLLIVVWVCMSIGSVNVSADTLKWDAPTGTVVGYNIYWSVVDSGVVPWVKSTPNVQYDLGLLKLPPATYTFFVTAYNDNGESEHSDSVEYVVDKYVPIENPMPDTGDIPEKPKNLKTLFNDLMGYFKNK